MSRINISVNSNNKQISWCGIEQINFDTLFTSFLYKYWKYMVEGCKLATFLQYYGKISAVHFESPNDKIMYVWNLQVQSIRKACKVANTYIHII